MTRSILKGILGTVEQTTGGEDGMDDIMQIKQFLGVVKSQYATFNVYNSGNPRYVVLRVLIPGLEASGCEGTLEFARKRSEFKRGILPRG